MTSVLHVSAFDDNYIWFVKPEESNQVIIVDPGDETPVFQFLKSRQLTPAAIFCTHHHWDHVGGVAEIRARYDIPVYGPAAEDIPTVTHPVTDGDSVEVPELGLEFQVIGVPGHTRAHIAFDGHNILLAGDTLFSGGCGRLFEGTPEDMFRSLGKLAKLPADTRMYAAHEYTLDNLHFGQTVEPDNPVIRTYIEEIQQTIGAGQPSLPSTLGKELEINPFLRTSTPAVIAAATQKSGHTPGSEAETFAALRRWKDGF